jgi:hypothetical protein
VIPRRFTPIADLVTFVRFVARCHPRRSCLVDHSFLLRAAESAGRSVN